MVTKIKTQICKDLDQAMNIEWIDTNGTGGYASSTITGGNSRKYHGLLVTRLENPPGKYVLLSKYEESLVSSLDDSETYVSTSIYSGSTQPQGNRFLTEFKTAKTPLFKFNTPDINITKQISMIQGENTVITSYKCTKNDNDSKLIIRPLLAFRDFHGLSHSNSDLQVRTFPAKNGFFMTPYNGMPSIYIQITGDFEFFPAPDWYRNFHYQKEMERGFEHTEDLFCPGMFEITLNKGDNILVSASVNEIDNIDEVWTAEQNRRSLFFKALRGTTMQKTLKWSALQFLSTDKDGHKAITAGFPWFLEWGRDAMIALPGLMLENKKNPAYIDVLKGFAKNIKQGVVPNFLGITKEQNAYNSADASLWFAWAVQQYYYKTKDYFSLRRAHIPQALNEIYEYYKAGTINNIHMRKNGLIHAGSPDTQLTWMDANSAGKPVTPRHGCPVEINALWYNFVCFMAELEQRKEIKFSADAKKLAPVVQKSFIKTFWLKDKNYLADLSRDDIIDSSIRPNQIFAVSLPHSPLTGVQRELVVNIVRQHLYTPLGLRTLSPDDPSYIGSYNGGPDKRDASYHNGTVWPWLLGHYVEALIRTVSDKTVQGAKLSDIQNIPSENAAKEAVLQIEEIIEAFRIHILNDGAGTISEIFDGDNPLQGKGCISQAWSVAEVLRITQFYEQIKKEHPGALIGSKHR